MELVPIPKRGRARSQTSSRSGDRSGADHQSGGGGLSNGIMEEYSYDEESDSPYKDIRLE